ncbi:hypothetical protein [Engelhardtia mirabilis]|uniref:hypothetical protein n=1 Tax=Engelhardtia mirabilis TaxID=2528011 RepID=UPI0011A2C30F
MAIDYVTDYQPGETDYGQGPISLFGSNHMLGPNNSIAGNPVPLTLRGGGLLPGSVVPTSGNQQNVAEFLDNIARGVIDLGALDVPYLWREGSAFGDGDLSGIVEVEPGTRILFEPSAEALASFHSRFNALGTPDAPIVLEAADPAQPWAGIRYKGNDRRPKLEHCIVRGAEIGVVASDSYVRLESCLLEQNDFGATAAQFGTLEVGKTRILDNAIGARATGLGSAHLEADPNPNWFEGNGIAVQSEVLSGEPVEDEAQGAYWGGADGPQHPSNPGGSGDLVEGPVGVLRFLATPPDFDDHPPVVRVPRITSSLEPGSKLHLRWTVEDDGEIVSHRIEYSAHGDNPGLAPIVEGISGLARSFEVTIPDPVPSSNINPSAFRIVAVDDAGQEGWSDVLFFDAEYGEQPFAFETDLSSGVTVGQPYSLAWGGVWGNLYLQLEDLGTFVDLGYGLEQPMFSDRVPAASTDLARYALFCAGEDRWYFSDNFELRPHPWIGDAPPMVAMTSPSAGDAYHSGGIVAVTWTVSDDEALRGFDLQASYDGGRTWHWLIDDLPATQFAYDWRLSSSDGIADVRVRVIARDRRVQASSDGSDVVFSIDGCGNQAVQPVQVVRSGLPANPAALQPTTGAEPVVGSIWSPSIDHSTFEPGAVADFLLVGAIPANLPLGVEGTLLCDLGGPFVLLSATAPGAPFAVGLPDTCTLVGAYLTCQGAALTPTAGIRLTNGLDILVGQP